ncbi:GCN5-related N-acetyltransferase [unidentified eubacterium SCB49]|nr:GCN5-related N-acetyltransferase [unidentified eubacterium SCB49]
MSILIRKALKEDMPAVLLLIKELAVYEKEPDAVKIDSETLIEEGFGENPLFFCFVAEVEGKVVGIALTYFVFSTWKGRTLHLEDLIVTEKMRGTGVGMALYKRVMEFGKEEGVSQVKWIVLDWNTPSIDFYEKTGAVMDKNWYIAAMDNEKLTAFLEK